MPPNREYSPGQLDAVARQRGFPDYRTWQAWNRHRTAGLQQPGGPVQPQPAPTNWLQNLITSIPGHPAQLLDYVSKKFGAATGAKP